MPERGLYDDSLATSVSSAGELVNHHFSFCVPVMAVHGPVGIVMTPTLNMRKLTRVT